MTPMRLKIAALAAIAYPYFDVEDPVGGGYTPGKMALPARSSLRERDRR
jgi:hypothetical protein